MEPFKKARVAHIPKYDPKVLEKQKEPVESMETTPKVIAAGSVTHEPLFIPSSTSGWAGDPSDASSLSDSSLSPDQIKTTQFALRPRPKDCTYDEQIMTLKSIKKGLQSEESLKRKWPSSNSKPNKKKKAESEVTASWEDVLEMVSSSCETDNPPPPTLVRPCKNTLDWDNYLKHPENLFNIPPVEYFRNAPLRDIWAEIAKVGLAVELRNPFVKGSRDVFWLGTIIYFAGYKALVRFESFTEDPEHVYLAWITFCSDVPRHLGWCEENGMELEPGPVVSSGMSQKELHNHIQEFMKRTTIDQDHERNLYRAIRLSRKFSPILPVEVMDKDNLIVTRLGRIAATIGNRMLVAYYKDDEREEEQSHTDGTRALWYHDNAESIHPLGWSHTVGIQLTGLNVKANLGHLPVETLPQYPKDKVKIKVGMCLETRHPIMVYKIVGAQVVSIFRHGYFMIETREATKHTRVKFIYHVTSPFVLPLGFGASHGIDADFALDERSCSENRMRLDLLPEKPSHGFKVGHKLEAFDLLDASYCAPATVVKVAGHLLLLHFDNWNKKIQKNYQWVDVDSSDIYPCGYREMMGIEWHGCLDDPFPPLED